MVVAIMPFNGAFIKKKVERVVKWPKNSNFACLNIPQYMIKLKNFVFKNQNETLQKVYGRFSSFF